MVHEQNMGKLGGIVIAIFYSANFVVLEVSKPLHLPHGEMTYQLRDLKHDFDTMSWATFHGESHLSNGQHYGSSLLRAPSDSLPGGDKDSLKQTILKNESIFRNQVIELHRLYRVQKNLTDEILREEQYNPDRVLYEASSSSSIFRSELITDDAQGRNSSTFLFTNLVCDGPPVSVQGIIQPQVVIITIRERAYKEAQAHYRNLAVLKVLIFLIPGLQRVEE